MAVTNFTPLLGLAKPTTGDLSGTWGGVVNDSITSLIDTAIAGATTFTTDTDVTLTDTNGAPNQARAMILKWETLAGTTTRYINAPAKSKVYVVYNNTGGTQNIILRGNLLPPTTGITIQPGERCLAFWDDTEQDFVKIATSRGVSAISFGSTGLLPSTLTSGDVTVSGVLNIANGGTGTNTATGTGSVVLQTLPALVAPSLGTPTFGVLTNCTGLPLSTGVTGTLPVANGGTGSTTFSAGVIKSSGGTNALTTGLVSMSSEVTGTLPVANGGTGVTTLTGLVKGNGTSAFTAAVAGTDYAPPTTSGVQKILAGNGLGGFTNVTLGAGLDYNVGTNTLNTTGGAGTGTVTQVSVNTANGIQGSVATPTTTPNITLSVLANGILKGNAGAITSATVGVDYAPATGSTSLLYGNGSGGFSGANVTGGLSFLGGNLSVSSVSLTSQVSGTLPVSSGGTGQTVFTDGQLLIGNSSGTLSKATLTQGTGISITNGNGSITISSTGTSGVSTFSGGTTGLTPATATSGPITLGGTLAVANGGTGVTTSTGSGSNVLSDSPALTGTPTAPTQLASDNSTRIATTAYVKSQSFGTTTNAVTFNNGGAGAASGTTFDGSAARTISYNTVGAPSTTGTNATGTWGINISGNAATATSATNATNATNVGGYKVYSGSGTTNASGELIIGYGPFTNASTIGISATGTSGTYVVIIAPAPTTTNATLRTELASSGAVAPNIGIRWIAVGT